MRNPAFRLTGSTFTRRSALLGLGLAGMAPRFAQAADPVLIAVSGPLTGPAAQ